MAHLLEQVNKFFTEKSIPLKVEYIEKNKKFNLILVKDSSEKYVFVKIKKYNDEDLIDLLIESSFEYTKKGILTPQQFEELFDFLIKLKTKTLILIDNKLIPFKEIVKSITLEDFQEAVNKKLKN